MKKILLLGLALGLLLFGITGTATAYTLNVDFGGSPAYAGLGVAPGDTGTFWNQLYKEGSSTLFYSDNTAATGISVSTTAAAMFTDDKGVIPDNLVNDWLYGQLVWPEHSSFTVTISGLDNAQKYDLYIFGGWPEYDSTYTVGSVSDYVANADGSPFVYHDDYAILQGLSPTNGQIIINVSEYNNSNYPAIGGFQLQAAVPVPPSLILLGSGIAGLISIRIRGRRKR